MERFTKEDANIVDRFSLLRVSSILVESDDACNSLFFAIMQTVAMKFILKHGKSEKDIHNLRQEIEVLLSSCIIIYLSDSCGLKALPIYSNL